MQVDGLLLCVKGDGRMEDGQGLERLVNEGGCVVDKVEWYRHFRFGERQRGLDH